MDLPDKTILPPDIGPTCRSCGGHDFKISHEPNPHNEADLITKIGQIVKCGSCIREAGDLNWLQSLDPSKIFHARFDSDSYYFFRRNPASPSGFTAIGKIGSTPVIDVMIRRVRAILHTDAAYQPLAIEISSYGGMRRMAKRE
ncbi:MAG: hypothetical protein M3Z09_08050 [Acidobacteriota bacterium]|nr:hypothetical protein [Acidobacteriota bacterium]